MNVLTEICPRPRFWRGSSTWIGRSVRVAWTLALLLLLVPAAPASAAGATPEDPVILGAGTGPINLTIPGSRELWLRVAFQHSPNVSHLQLETVGSLDTELEVYASVREARRGEWIGRDDNSGASRNASLAVPVGFLSPYLVRLSSNRSGFVTLVRTVHFETVDRCDWPAGCPLAVAAQGQLSGLEGLALLREVRSEVLSETARGRELIGLYWRLAGDLVKPLLLDSEFRQELYSEVSALLPLAVEALGASRGTGGRTDFSEAHLERLEALSERIERKLSPELAFELAALRSEFALAGQVGRPVADVLQELGLLPEARRPATVLVKLLEEPRPAEKGLGWRTGSAVLDALFAKSGAASVRRLHQETPQRRAAGLTRTLVIEVESQAAARQLVEELRGDSAVEWARLSVRLRIQATGRDPYRADLWGLDAVRAPQAWSTTTGLCSTLVAVVDTGLRRGLADLEGRAMHDLGFDFPDRDADANDNHGHGTHVAGTIAAALNNATSVAGVAPSVCVFGVKVLGDDGSGTEEDVAEGIVHAVDQGARVINLSLGCDCDVLPPVEEALEYAARRGVVVVAAAGNDSNTQLGYPASSVHAISVGAVDSDLELASFSNTGAGLDVVAPGVDVASTFRDGESCYGSGTSMASPHAAGVAALLLSKDPTLSRQQVRSILQQSARDLGRRGYDTTYGFGLVDAKAALDRVQGAAGEPCRASATTLCLAQERFKVEAFWRRPDGSTGQGKAVRLTPNTGYFWFFNQANVELLTKVLDACSSNPQRFWVFAGGLTNLEVRLRVTDTVTGAIKEYLNPLRTSYRPVQDTQAFATCNAKGAPGSASPSAADLPGSELEEWAAFDRELATAAKIGVAPWPNEADIEGLPGVWALPGPGVEQIPETAASRTTRPKVGSCSPTSTSLCLEEGRFRVEARWRRPGGQRGVGSAGALTDNTGYFWFFDQKNIEVVVKVLDACSGGLDRFWVFAGGLTNVEVDLTVTDTESGQVRTYRNPIRTPFQPIQDTNAFATCP